MADSKDDSSTMEETKVNFEFKEVLEAFIRMHEEVLITTKFKLIW